MTEYNHHPLSGLSLLSTIELLTSAVSLFYYFRVVKVMYLRDVEADRKVTLTWNEKIAVAVTIIGTLGVGIYPTGLLDFIRATFS